jgi:hypothetical protein
VAWAVPPTISIVEAWPGGSIFSASSCMRDAKIEHDAESPSSRLLDVLSKINHAFCAVFQCELQFLTSSCADVNLSKRALIS